MLDIKHIKTFYIGTEDNDERALPEESETVRFCVHTMQTYAPVIDKLSEVFLKAQIAYQDGYLTGPKKVSILVPESMIGRKFKEEDGESNLERVLWFISEMRAPACGMIVSVYTGEHHERDVDSHWTLTNLWPLKQVWYGKESNYVTVHLPEPNSNVTWNKQNFQDIWDHVRPIIQNAGYEIKYINYSLSYKQTAELLAGSKLHLSYVGGSYIFSGVTFTPTIGVGVNRHKNNNTHNIVEGLPFYYTGYPKNIWGLGPMQEDRVWQIVDLDEMKAANDYVHHVIDTADLNEVEKYVRQALSGNYRSFKKPAVQDITVGKEPWFYVSVDNFLSEDDFERLKAEALEVPVKDGEVSRKIMGYDPTPQIESFIRTFGKARDTMGVEIRPFKKLKKFIHYAITPPNFTHKMHIEAPFKIMSAVLYLGPEENIGTRLYRTEDDKEPIEVEWKPNRLFVFCGYDHTWHDYASTSTRYTYNYFLVNPDVVENEEYKAGLI